MMTSLVAILGLLPASLATSLGSDVQRPLATVIIWGLTGSTLFTLFVTPVFYRIFVPPLPNAQPIQPIKFRDELYCARRARCMVPVIRLYYDSQSSQFMHPCGLGE